MLEKDENVGKEAKMSKTRRKTWKEAF